MTAPLDDKYTQDTYNMDTQLSMMKKFACFWSNVSKVDATKCDDRGMQAAIVDGLRSIQPAKRRY